MKRDLEYYQKELREKQVEIKILRRIGDTITYQTHLKEILSAIIKIVSDYISSDSCFIYLLEDDTLVLQASQNPHKTALGKIKIKKGEGITGWVAAHKKIVALPKAAYEDERFKLFNQLPEDRYEAFLSLPITWKGQVVGVINIQHIKPTKYKKDQILFLEVVARQVAGAIEQARLLSETNYLKEALETRRLVDRAKAVLMKTRNLSESEAHKLLSKTSMDKRKSLKEVAEAILLSSELMH